MKDGKQLFSGNCDKARELAYPQMSVQQICDMPVRDITADNCHLYIWVINKYLPDVFKVIDAWGFKYSCPITWAKKPMGGAWVAHSGRVLSI